MLQAHLMVSKPVLSCGQGRKRSAFDPTSTVRGFEKVAIATFGDELIYRGKAVGT